MNRGRVRVTHSAKQDGSTVTFGIGTDNGKEGIITRAIRIRIRPLSLSLVNLTSIEYIQVRIYYEFLILERECAIWPRIVAVYFCVPSCPTSNE